MSNDRTTPVARLRTVHFIAKLEQAIDEGNADFIEANMPRQEEIIGLLQDRSHELAQMQYRARVVRDRHEPPAEKRVKAR